MIFPKTDRNDFNLSTQLKMKIVFNSDSYKKNIIFILVLTLTVKSCNGESCSRFQIPSPLAGSESKKLTGFTYFETTNLPNLISCGIRCLKQRKCKSVNFNDDINICQLNSESHVSKTSSFISSLDFQYYYTGDWPQDILGPCVHHGCPDEQVCEPGSPPSAFRYNCTQCVPQDGCANCLSKITVTEVSGVLKQYTPIGCFRALLYNPLQILLTDLRQPKSGFNFDWKNMHKTIERCATDARVSGYKYFGIEFYGECWVDKKFDASNHTLVKASACATNRCERGYGGEDIMFVYQHKIKE